MKYVKKPIPIEAIQWTGDNFDEIYNFMNDCHPFIDPSNNLYIKTLEGDMLAEPYSYIIKGVEGEFYPCRGDIFEKTYVKLNERLTMCPQCRRDFSSTQINIFYDELNKKYKYWNICPYCGTRNIWEV